MPFLCESVEKFVRRLMNMCVHKHVLDKAPTMYYLVKVDLNDKANLLMSNSQLLLNMHYQQLNLETLRSLRSNPVVLLL